MIALQCPWEQLRAANKGDRMPEEQSRRASVTPRERQIIEALVRGATARELAEELRLSFHTVRTHVRNIYAKLGVANRIELLRWQQQE